MSTLPTGTVTFLFTDVEGSTRLWEEHPATMRAALARHDALIEAIIDQHAGVVVRPRGEGDSRFAVFARATDAMAAATALQQALQAEEWSTPAPLRVRLALHTGEADLREGDYYGTAVNRCARLRAVAHGGQTLLSQATYDLARDALPPGVSVHDLGEHQLADLYRPEHVYQVLAPGLQAGFPALRSLDSLPNNLPVQVTSLIGREQEIATVTRLLDTTQLLTLTGAGGAGKTRLALQVAASVVAAYRNGVWFVDLAPLAEPSLVPQTVAAACGIREASGRPTLDVVADALRGRHVLLVLDNCEHLIAACAQVANALLRSCPQVQLLATSREPLGLAGETVWRVPSLTLPDPAVAASLGQLTQYEAVRLFIERATAVRPDFQVTNATARALAQICWRLDGIPLAIELAAARVRVLSLEQIAARLDDRFRLLTGGSRAALPRQQTLRALVDWSHGLLIEEEKVLLRRLAVFAGGWTLEAAEAICPDAALPGEDVLDLLTGLVDKSLVLADEQQGEVRYQMLETIRQYAAEKLAASGDGTSVARRHAGRFLVLAEEAASGLAGAAQLAWLAQLDRELDNLRAALRWCVEQGRTGDSEAVEWGLRLTMALGFYWNSRARREGLAWYRQFLAFPQAGTRTLLRAQALLDAAMLILVAGDDATEAQVLWTESAAIAQEIGRPDLAAVALTYVGTGTQDPMRRQALLEGAVALARRTDDVGVLATALIWLGSHYVVEGDVTLAGDCFGQSHALFTARGERLGISMALDGLGSVARALADRTTARRRYEEKRALAELVGDKHSIAYALQALGELSEEEGDVASAWTGYVGALTHLREVPDLQRAMTVLRALASLCLARGEPTRALRLAGAVTAAQSAAGPHWRLDIAVQQKLAPHQDWAQIRALAQAVLGPEAAAAWAEGQAMTLEQAIRYALEQPAPG